MVSIRAERRQQAKRRREEIVLKIADIVKAEMAAGRGWEMGIAAADRQLGAECAKCPQEVHMYKQAAAEFSRRILTGVAQFRAETSIQT